MTMVYILVFLCGEGLTRAEIEAQTTDFPVIMRYWLRVCQTRVYSNGPWRVDS